MNRRYKNLFDVVAKYERFYRVSGGSNLQMYTSIGNKYMTHTFFFLPEEYKGKLPRPGSTVCAKGEIAEDKSGNIIYKIEELGPAPTMLETFGGVKGKYSVPMRNEVLLQGKIVDVIPGEASKNKNGKTILHYEVRVKLKDSETVVPVSLLLRKKDEELVPGNYIFTLSALSGKKINVQDYAISEVAAS